MHATRTSRTALLSFAFALLAALFVLAAASAQPAEAASGSLQATSLSATTKNDTTKTVELYRLYNRRSGEHLYTTDANERNVLTKSYGWRYEGTSCTLPAKSGTPVYRLYNPRSGEHHYTTDAHERNVLTKSYGWRSEGIGWYSDADKKVPVYRLYHPRTGEHHYTTDTNERNVLTKSYGWRSEGTGWFAVAAGKPVANPYGDPNALRKKLKLITDIRPQFSHGPKPAQYQKYIVLHDTEGEGPVQNVLNWWVYSGRGVATHFVVGKDGTILQCVPMDKIAHHAGLGTPGHNAKFGVDNSSRDDAKHPGNQYSNDYGMNSYSIGIEMVHAGNNPYPVAQLQALDNLIAYIDAYYGFESRIIDHKMWRLGNSDTSAAFAGYLANYQRYRSYRR